MSVKTTTTIQHLLLNGNLIMTIINEILLETLHFAFTILAICYFGEVEQFTNCSDEMSHVVENYNKLDSFMCNYFETQSSG